MIEFVVRVPDPQNTEPVFLSGDVPELGRWHPRGTMMHSVGQGLYHALIPIFQARTTRFLYTRGDWRRVEQMESGGEHPSRELYAEPGSRIEQQVAGWGRESVRYHPDFHSRFLPNDRGLNVWLPPGYGIDPFRRYPVVYMHDGQNLFDAHAAFAGNPWRCDEMAEQAVRRGQCEPVLVVGIANSPERIREYGPKDGDDLASRYGRMLVEEVKPFIDATYRTRPEAAATAIGGASLGGLISLHLAKWYPEVFGKCIAMSPSVWWDRERFIETLRENTRWLETCKVWMDIGGREGGSYEGMVATLERTRRLGAFLRSAMPAKPGVFHYVEDPDGRHNETDWGRRFPDALAFLFPAG
jgi:predicted alpha/beta superfamily hydrolase